MRHTALLLLLSAALTPLAMASAEDDVTSLSYISYLERYATVQPASQEDALEAMINLPLVPGDRADTARQARLEAQLSDGAILWLDEYTSLSFDAIAFSRDTKGDRTVLFLAEGGIAVEIPDYALATSPTRVDTTSATVYLEPNGLYRLQRLDNGGLRVEVWQGIAEAATAAGGVPVRAGSAAEVSAGQVDRTEEVLNQGDEFGQWVAQRRYELQGDSGLHLEERFQREGELLDSYGSWVYVDSHDTWAWHPQVSSSWSPYTAGRWYWTSVGWSWVSYEPWGWLPYHYGSWYYDPVYGWVWYQHSYWGPSWVSWISWGGYIGWCPRGYYDYWWYGRWCCNYWWYAPGGGGDPHPPAADTRPPRSVQGLSRNDIVGAGQGDPIGPSAFALDSSGIVQAEKLDGSAWNLVPASDFASPHLPRLIENGEQVLRGAEGMGEAIVLSGPLVTPSPAVGRTTELLEQRFEASARENPTDVTPIFARDPGLQPGQGGDLVRPTTASGLSRNVTPAPRTTSAREVSTPSASGSRSPVSVPARRESPNIHRPAPSSDAGSPRAGSSSRPTITSPTIRRTPQTPSSSGSVRPDNDPSSTRTQPGASTRTPSRPPNSYSSRSLRSSSSSSRPSVYPRSPYSSSSRSAAVPRSYPSSSTRSTPSRSGGSRPMIVPRSNRSSTVSPSAPSYSRRPSSSAPSRSVTRSSPSSRSVTSSSPRTTTSSRSSTSQSAPSAAPRAGW